MRNPNLPNANRRVGRHAPAASKPTEQLRDEVVSHWSVMADGTRTQARHADRHGNPSDANRLWNEYHDAKHKAEQARGADRDALLRERRSLIVWVG